MTDYLSFRVGGQWYGVPVDAVIRVLHRVALDELPLAAPEALGLMRLAEQVVPVVDLRRRFQVGAAPLSLQTPLIALETPNGPVGLVVDDVDTVLHVDAVEPVDGVRQQSTTVQAVARLDDHLLLLLDVAQLGRLKVHANEFITLV